MQGNYACSPAASLAAFIRWALEFLPHHRPWTRTSVRISIRCSYVFSKQAVCFDGKKAWTKFEKVKFFEREGEKYSLLKVVLKTGRTHQIRVHFSYLGWPLVGDSVYGGKNDLLNRPFLHSKKIKVTHPNGKKLELEVEIGDDLQLVLEKLWKRKY